MALTIWPTICDSKRRRRAHTVAHGAAVGKRGYKCRAPEARHMSHSYVHNPVQLVRAEAQPRLWAYLAGVCKKQRIFVHEIGGMEDHIHMLIEIPPVLAYSDAIEKIKTTSSQWMGRDFSWQRGYGLF